MSNPDRASNIPMVAVDETIAASVLPPSLSSAVPSSSNTIPSLHSLGIGGAEAAGERQSAPSDLSAPTVTPSSSQKAPIATASSSASPQIHVPPPSAAPPSSTYPCTTPHLNPHGLLILRSETAGRGIFASRALKARTVLEISPVLLFPAEEYEQHGKFTALDGYTFVWKRGEGGKSTMALALGLGSLFNHHPTSPNVSYSLSHSTHSIHYTLIRDAGPGEELCISYGAGPMWWEDTQARQKRLEEERRERMRNEDPAPEWGMMAALGQDSDGDDDGAGEEPSTAETSGAEQSSAPTSQTEVTAAQPAEPLATPPPPSRAAKSAEPREVSATAPKAKATPLTRVTQYRDPNTLPVELTDAWVVDIEPRASGAALQFVKKNKLDAAETRHLRQFRRLELAPADEDADADAPAGESSKADGDGDTKPAPALALAHPRVQLTALICLQSAHPSRSDIFSLFQSASFLAPGSEPYITQVPTTPAPSKARLSEWTKYWPVALRSPPLPGTITLTDPENGKATQLWTEARTAWVRAGFRHIVRTAREAKARGELPVCAYVTDAPVEFDSVAAVRGKVNLTTEKLLRAGTRTQNIDVTAHDTRVSTRHPLRHAVLNAIREVARVRAEREIARTGRSRTISPLPDAAATSPGPALEPSAPSAPALPTSTDLSESSRSNTPNGDRDRDYDSERERSTNGQDYLLTNLTLFTTHEPCILCSMALVHSRVRAVYFVYPSPGSGGCCGDVGGGAGGKRGSGVPGQEQGGPYAIHEQPGLNHRFDVWRWTGDERELLDTGPHADVENSRPGGTDLDHWHELALGNVDP